MIWTQRTGAISPFSFFLILVLVPGILAIQDREDITNRPIYISSPSAFVSGRLAPRQGDGKPRPKPDYVAHPASDLVCRPFGACEPCPSDELDQPFCLPFGNRRLLHCLPADQAHDAGEGGDTRQPAGEVPAWEACGRVVRKERQDFWEFVTANLLFLIVALAVLWGRSSALASAQYRQLAARIGIPGGTWRT